MWWKIIFVFPVFFSFLTNGELLDLSWKGLTKEKFFRDQNGTVSEQVEKATKLNLRGNLFDRFVDCSAKLDKLEDLDLSQNKLTKFYFVCRDEDHLYKLNVSHNELSFLNDTVSTDKVTNLEILDLSHNIIQLITQETFQHLKNLTHLYLDSNPIGNNIHADAFKNSKLLLELQMSNILASNLSEDLFSPLINLKYLSLAENPLKEIPFLPASIERLDLSRTDILKLKNLDLPNLRSLTLHSMPKFESIDFNDLKKLENLTTLSIENSPKFKYLTAIPPLSEYLLPNIKKIVIRHCSIDKISDDLRSVLQKTSHLDLQDNPWNCNCNIKWILSLKIDYHDHLRCESPPEHHDKRIFEIPADQFQCDNGINYMALWLAMGVLGSVGMIAGVSFLAKEPIRRLLVKSNSGDTVSYRNMITSSENKDTEKILDPSDITDCL